MKLYSNLLMYSKTKERKNTVNALPTTIKKNSLIINVKEKLLLKIETLDNPK